MTRARAIDLVAVAIAIAVLIVLLITYFERGFVPGDAYVYLAAGERLNAGHDLYALVAGDRPVGLEPPFWTVPLLSPPPIAVLFRPLAALPSELGVYVWWAVDVLAVLVTVGLLMARRPLITSVFTIALAIPLVYEIGVGNMNGLILLALVLAWRATTLGNERSTGMLVGVAAALKVTPVVLVWWLLTARRWRAVGAAVTAASVILVVSLVGAGLDAHLRYLGIVRESAALGARPLSLAGIALFVGVPADVATILPTIALIAGGLLIAAFRNRPAIAYLVAILTMVFGSPTVSINWFTYLLACLAPVAWPLTAPRDKTEAVTAPAWRTARTPSAAPGERAR